MKSRASAVLFMAVLVDMIGFGIVIPVLPFYATSFGASPVEVTALFAAYSAMQMIATPVWGRVSDQHGRRPLLIAGLFASAISHLIFGLAASLWLLFVSRLAAGAAGGTIAVAHAYIADTTTAEDRAHHMGLVGAAAGLGVMIGPAIGGFVSQWGLALPGFVAAGLSALNGLAAMALLAESRPANRAGRARSGQAATLQGWFRTMTSQPIALMMVVYFLAISSFTGMTALLALYTEAQFGMNARDMGIVFSIAGGATVVVRGVLLGRLVKRFGERNVVRLGASGLFLSLILMIVVPGGAWVPFVVVIYAFGAGTLFPTLATLVSFATDSESQGAVLGGSQVVGGLGRVTGPIWYGALFQNFGHDSPFLVGALLVAISWILAASIPTSLRPTRSSPVTEMRDTVEEQTLAPD
ncbi:MAG: MFS transporter [Longimicrobiales bacterium]